MADTRLNRQHRLAYIARGPEWAFALPSGDLTALDDVLRRCSTFWNGANSLLLSVDEDGSVAPTGDLLTTRPVDGVWLHPRLGKQARTTVSERFGARAHVLGDRYDLGEPHALSTESDSAPRRSMLIPVTSDPDLHRIRMALWGDIPETDLPNWRRRFDVAEVGGTELWSALLDGQIAAHPMSPLTQTLFGMSRVAQSGPLDWPYLYVLPDKPGFEELVRFWNFRSRMAVDVLGMPVVGLCRDALDHPDHLRALLRWVAPAPGSQRTPDLLVAADPDIVDRLDEALATAGLERDRGDRLSWSTGETVVARDRPIYRYRSPEIGGRLLRGSHGVALATFSAGRASLTLAQPRPLDIGRGHTVRIVLRELPLPMPLTDGVARLVGGQSACVADGVLVTFVFFGEWMVDIAVPSAREALDAWAADRGVAYGISQPGRYAETLMSRLDSLERLDALAADMPVRILTKLTPVSRLRLARRLADELRAQHDLDEAALAEHLRGQDLGLDLPSRSAADLAGHGTRLSDVLAAMTPLLEAGYVRRGRSLRCPSCNFHLWIALDAMAEEIRCDACRAPFTLPVAGTNGREAPLEFRLDGLTARAMDQGLLPVLLAVRAIRAAFTGYEVTVWPGVELELENNKVDVDVLAFGPWLLCCEVKTHADGLEREQLDELLALCDRIEARPGLAALDGSFAPEDVDAVRSRGGLVFQRTQLLK